MSASTLPSISEITRQVKTAAAEAGFDTAGIAGVREFPELEYFPRWIAEGRGGEMAYLQARDEQGRLKRASLRFVAPWARSVVVCALNYNSAQPCSTQVRDSDRGWISRYAWSRRDYHNVVLKKLKQVEARISGQWSVGSGQFSRGRDRVCDAGRVAEIQNAIDAKDDLQPSRQDAEFN